MKIVEANKTVATIYYVFRYNLRPEAGAEYQQWLADHAGTRSERMGWTYMGTFIDVMGFDQYDYETRWELNGHGSVSSRPLDAETEQQARDRLSFIENGQVSMMRALRGFVQ